MSDEMMMPQTWVCRCGAENEGRSICRRCGEYWYGMEPERTPCAICGLPTSVDSDGHCNNCHDRSDKDTAETILARLVKAAAFCADALDTETRIYTAHVEQARREIMQAKGWLRDYEAIRKACPLVGCPRTGPHIHESGGPSQERT